MTTLAELEEQKRELEARLEAGDPAAEAALARLDRAICARRQKIGHRRKRLAVAHDAVAAGMSVEDAHKPGTGRSPRAAKNTRRPLNRFE
ncbi:MAG: hypothetical protein ACE5G3_05600 [Gammaproteobacteria bacterium]